MYGLTSGFETSSTLALVTNIYMLLRAGTNRAYAPALPSYELRTFGHGADLFSFRQDVGPLKHRPSEVSILVRAHTRNLGTPPRSTIRCLQVRIRHQLAHELFRAHST